MRGISSLSEELLSSQEGIIFLDVDIVIVIVIIHRSVMISVAVTWLLVL